MPQKRAVLFANGEMKDEHWLKSFLRGDDLLIAVDGGLHRLEALGLIPDILIGDLDSVTPAQVERARSAGAEVRRYPPAKDETDLELALLAAVELDCGEIIIVAGLGGRLDQTLGNLSLLLLPALAGRSVRFEDGTDEVSVIHGTAEIHGRPGDVVSLLPLWGAVEGVTTTDLQYPLKGETLYPQHTRGISNVLTAPAARVEAVSGLLLCIHAHSIPLEEK